MPWRTPISSHVNSPKFLHYSLKVKCHLLLYIYFFSRNSLKLYFSGPPAESKNRVNPSLRRIDDWPICTSGAWVISPAAVAAAPDGIVGMAVGCAVIQGF